ncbi:MAG: hypothetical protein DIJKHBIC_04757 [Thermoanaerobaculia bacterium]|nr:hypothetical protein [Thermoanaerobaculia bacterium]
MRTTIEWPDALLKEAKVRAIEKGISLKEFVRTAVERELGLREGPGARRSFPVLKSQAPRTLHLTNREIERLLQGEETNEKKTPV